MSERWLVVCGAVSGFLAVALGAFGAHGLKATFAAAEDGAQRLAWWTTASQYHLAHSLALVLVGLLAGRGASWTGASGIAFLVGVVLFSGSLYVMALTGQRALGAVTPIGGVGFLAGWLLLAVAAWGLGGR